MRRRWLARMWLVGLMVVLLAGVGTPAGRADFNGDGYADLVVGAPYENMPDATDAGSVNVIYGARDGLSGVTDEFWVQNYLDGSNSEPFEYFGMALAVGDFNGDGYFDLAVGVPEEDVGSVGQAGAVSVIYGTASGGLDVSGNQYWNQNEADMGDVAETNDFFGRALAAGDFNGDGYDDLAVGIPGEDIGSTMDAGGMMVLYGSAGGLTAADTVWNEGGGAETGDLYGSTLAAGDFNHDGYDDLAVGIPYEDLGSVANAGAVQIYYGSGTGLYERVSNDFWHQDRSGVADVADEHDFFGLALAVGDFNGDSYADLAVGVPYEDVVSPEVLNAGAVNVLYGSEDGITASGSDYWDQDVGGVGSICEEDDRFGFSLTAGDFNGDGYDELAVGVPYEHWNDPDTGIVQVLFGAADGLTDAGDQLWRQGLSEILDTEEPNDRYGYALAAGDFNGDGYADLGIGIPYEAINTISEAGAVNVLYGTESGLTATGNQFWYQGSGGLAGIPESGDRFGYALAALPVTRNHRVYLPLILRDS